MTRMEHLRHGVGVLRRAENSLRELVSKAAAGGDYQSVVRIAAWAQVVSDLVKKAPEAMTTPSATPEHTTSTPAGPKVDGSPKRAVATDSYPKFLRHGDQLVRIAWSKKEKKEYQHKMPYAVLQALVASMAETAADGRVFSTDQFLPLRDADGAEVPNYQAYVGIALIKKMALIDQHGRQGYSIPRMAEFKDAVEAVWQKLPKQ